jgi:hypothetical protein
MSSIETNQNEDATPLKIVGIYLTELGFVMAKVKMSNGHFMNYKISEIHEIIPPDLLNVQLDLSDWRFVPCCE